MKKVISFSLWGNNPKYVKGALENIKLQNDLFPDWTCRFYAHKSVPESSLKELEKGAEVILIEQDIDLKNYSTNGIHYGWFWRFSILNDSDVDRFIVRDVDSRLSLREKNCVKDWEKSGKNFHIIRDHPMHGVPILAGTWGATKEFSQSINYRDLVFKFMKNNPTNNSRYGGYDQFFLSTVIYPLLKDTACIHDDYHFYKNETVRNIPHIKTGNELIGESIEL